MYHKLRKHLTFLYTCITGMILTVLLFVCFLYMARSVESKNEAAFSSHFLRVSSRFQSDSAFPDHWLSQMEIDGRLIIHIEENGKSLFFKGAWTPQTPRAALLARAWEQSAAHGINKNVPPVSSSAIQSPLFTFSGAKNDRYAGKIIVLRTKRGCKSLTLLQDITDSKRQLLTAFFFFLLADLCGIVLFSCSSWFLVGKSIRPLKETQQKQTAFLAAASHELRTPVAVIRASAQAIPEAPCQAAQMLQNIEKECERMSRLISDLLFLASADQGRYALHIKEQDTDTLLLDTYEMFEPLYRKHDRKLLLLLPEEALPPLLCDYSRMIQIFSVLLDNALTYAPKESAVTLSSTFENHILTFSVADHGPGIPDNQKKQVFDRFFQADPSRKNSSHFGLGLSIAKELVRLQKGSLLLTDTPDGGCTFLIQFHLVS